MTDKLICQSDLVEYFGFMIAFDERLISDSESNKMRTFYDGSRAAFDCAKDAVNHILPTTNYKEEEGS